MINSLRRLSLAQKFTIIIIIILTIIVAIFSLYTINQPHNSSADYIESQITTLAKDYYENYFFPDLESSIHNHNNSNISDVLSSYTSTGFAEVPLRQILLHTKHDTATTSIITERCDTNTTTIHFFPDPPFSSTSYHITYDYSCNF